MRNISVAVTAVALLASLVAARPAHATCWELGLRVQNDSGTFVATQVNIYRNECNGFVGTWYSASSPGSDGVNFRVDLNSNCPNMPQLTPDVVYVFVFPGWGNKAFYFEGHLIPGEPVDDVFTVKPSSVTHYLGPGVQDIWGYPTATWTPLCLTLQIVQTTYIGDKITYRLRGTASGAPSYSFSWSNAYMTTAYNVNPSYATRTILRSQNVTVSCTVNGTLTKSIQLGGIDPFTTPVEPSTWGGVKAMYRN